MIVTMEIMMMIITNDDTFVHDNGDYDSHDDDKNNNYDDSDDNNNDTDYDRLLSQPSPS